MPLKAYEKIPVSGGPEIGEQVNHNWRLYSDGWIGQIECRMAIGAPPAKQAARCVLKTFNAVKHGP